MRKIILITFIVILFFGNLTIVLSHQTNVYPSFDVLTEEFKAIRIDNSYFVVNCSMTFSPNDFTFNRFQGFDIVRLEDGVYITEIGKPMLPVKIIRLGLPVDMKVTNLKILTMNYQVLDGMYTVFPAQPPQPTNMNLETKSFQPPDCSIYNSDSPYPSDYIKVNRQFDLAGQNIAEVAIYPMQYIGSQKRLTLITSITFALEGTSGYQCGDYLSVHASDSSRDIYEQMIKDMVINPKDVHLCVSSSPQPLGVPPGDYDYVIITTDSWVSAFQPLADWKTKKGIPATIVTTSWIYNSGGYSGTSAQKIRAFVMDAYNNWGTIYFLFGGDTDNIPTYTKYFTIGTTTYDVPSDTYYADYDDDWVCEVHIGRASVRSTTHINTFINKVFTYERNPPLTDYAKTAFYCGFDLTDYGSDEGEGCKVYIKNTWIPSGWTYRYEYDSESSNHKTEVLSNLNLGSHLVNHIDHSNTDQMGTGSKNHYQTINTNDALSRTNGNKQNILYSIGCWACDYSDIECIAEGFVHNTNGGSVGFIGNSRNGWYIQYMPDYGSLRFDRYFFRSLFSQNHYKLGVAFSDHKNDAYSDPGGGGSDAAIKHIFYGLTLLGDPEMPIWKENPISMTASYPVQITRATSSFTVTVTSSGTPVNQASVCLWKGTEVYLTGVTNSAGQKTFSLSPTTLGQLYVTVTKQNYLPYEGIATVVNQPPVSNFIYSPVNPRTIDMIQFTDTSADTDGTIISRLWGFGDGTTTNIQNPQHQYADDGTYLVTLNITDNDGGRHERTKIINVSNVPPNVNFTCFPLNPTTADTIHFNDTSIDLDGTIQTWSWDFGDGNNSTLRNTSHKYADDGVYTVMLNVTDDDGASATKSISVSVSNVPPVADFYYTPADSFTSDTIQFTDTSSDSDGMITVWLWSFGDGGSSTQQNATHKYSDDGEYIVILNITDDDGAKKEISKPITVLNTPPVASFNYEPINPETQEKVFFNSSSSDSDGTISNYTWDFGDGNSSYTQKTTHQYAQYGTYTITLNITDDDGDTDSKQTTIDVSPNVPPNTPSNPFPANGQNKLPLTVNLSWTGGDQNSDTVSYDVYYGTTDPPEKKTDNQSYTTYNPGILSFNTTYYWKIVAWDTHNTNSSSPIWNFTTRTNHAPVGSQDFYSTNEDTSLAISDPGVLSNDHDSDGDPMIALKVNDVIHGSLTLNNNGSFIYIPTMNYYGTDLFSYKVYDGYIYSSVVEVTITINPVNDLPVFGTPSPGNGSQVSQLNPTWNIPITDIEGDPFSWSIECINGQTNSSTDADNGTKALSLSGLVYSTTYKIWVNATDSAGSNQFTRKWYTFTPKPAAGGGGGDGGYTPPASPQNQKPIANVSAGIPYQGFINSQITFDGSKSYDPDGNITSWSWNFGDGTNGTGETIEHIYLSTGTFQVTLTVKDDQEATNSDTTTCVVLQPNRPPTISTISGPIIGTKNTKYEYTVVSTDLDNDTIRYTIRWDDETSYENTSEYFPSGTAYTCSHQWTTPGIYTIEVRASDNKTESQPGYFTILIDVKYVKELGYLIDQNADGLYDMFHCNNTMIETDIEKQSDGLYLIDSDGDGKWDHNFNPATSVLTSYTPQTPGFELIFVLSAILIALFLWRKRKK